MESPTEYSQAVDFVADPLPGDRLHRLLAEARLRPGPGSARLAGMPAALLTRFEDVKSFVSDEDRFPGGAMYRFQIEPAIGPTFISMDGEAHNHTRQLAMPMFRSRAVTRFVDDELVPLVHELVDRFVDRGEADLVAELTSVLPYWTISRKLGLPRGSEERQRRVARALLSHPVTPDAARRAAVKVEEIVEPILEERRRQPAEDVLSHLIAAEHDGRRLRDAEVMAHVRLLYTVGATTTADAMSCMFALVLGRPELLERSRSEPDLRPRMVHEALRFEPPVAVLPRSAPNGGLVGGAELQAGQIVLVALAGANRDPAVYSHPDAFDPDRPESEILSFGFGPKFCPGFHLARLQLLAALEVVVERLPGLRLVEAGEPSGAILRSVDHLHVAWNRS